MLLDRIRGTSVQAREAGAITQHIGATEVPIDHIYKVCDRLIGGKRFDVPGLLFIDTPGHHSFVTLRARGGSLADLAVLVIDIREGLMPQTMESIRILRQYRTPFVIALNKIDTIMGWSSEDGRPFILAEKTQQQHALDMFNDRLYKIIGQLAAEGLSADRYDRIDDFTKSIALVPLSAKEGEGVPDLLLVLVGLAQRFLEARLQADDSATKGTILEIKEEKGFGNTMDAILYSGTLRRGDTVALGTNGAPVVTRVRAILKPRPLDEIRDPRDRFESVREVVAAAGVKIACQNIEGVIAGAPMRVVTGPDDPAIDEMAEEDEIKVEVQEKGITIKADAIGSLEALAFEAKAAGILIRKYGIGNITRRDIIEAAYGDRDNNVVLGFNVVMSRDAEDELIKHDLKVMTDPIIYSLIEAYKEWSDESKRRSDADLRSEIPFPAKFMVLPNCIFRTSKPAIVGVRILAGRVRTGSRLITAEGRDAGRIRSIHSGDESLKEAKQGEEVAVGIEGVTAGRQIGEESVVYADLTAASIAKLAEADLTEDERMAMADIIGIKRREDPFWGI